MIFLNVAGNGSKIFGQAHTAMRWIPEGQIPTMQEAVEKLDYLQKNGASSLAFDFRKKIGTAFVAPQ